MRILAVAAGIPFALGSAAYKGVLFSTSSQPGWKDARWLGGYLTNSAIAIGCAAMLAIASILGQDAATRALRPALVVLLAINMSFLVMVYGELRPAIRAVQDGPRLLTTAGLGAAAGVVVPAGLVLAGGGLTLVLVALEGSSSGTSSCAGRS